MSGGFMYDQDESLFIVLWLDIFNYSEDYSSSCGLTCGYSWRSERNYNRLTLFPICECLCEFSPSYYFSVWAWIMSEMRETQEVEKWMSERTNEWVKRMSERNEWEMNEQLKWEELMNEWNEKN